MEHLFPAQIVVGVLTGPPRPNVYYELGIAHATQPETRQILIAEPEYEAPFDTHDMIYMPYEANLGNSVGDLARWIRVAVEDHDVRSERLIKGCLIKYFTFRGANLSGAAEQPAAP